MKDYYNNKTVDLLFMDIEGGEFSLLADLAEHTDEYPPICQMNFELHYVNQYPPNGLNIMDTMFKMVSFQKFLLLYTEKVGPFFRMYWVNVTHPKCYHKFFAN